VQSLPCSRVYVNTGDPIEERNLVEFKLLYEGELPSSGNNPHATDKHRIRRAFHPQLRRLWEVNPNLRMLAERAWVESNERVAMGQIEVDKLEQSRADLFDLGIKHIGRTWHRAGYDLVPLVVPEHLLRCSIEILLLRPEDWISENRKLLSDRGDLDGQVKTIVDALRMPDKPDETGNAQPDEDEHPLFCLLKDDGLVSEIKITADQLLMLPQEYISERDKARGQLNIMIEDSQCKWNFNAEQRAALKTAQAVLASHGPIKATDAFAVIHVKLNHRDARAWDNYFG
jgi:hypothetical protein